MDESFATDLSVIKKEIYIQKKNNDIIINKFRKKSENALIEQETRLDKIHKDLNSDR